VTITETLQSAVASGVDRLEAQLLLLHVLDKAPAERAWLLAHGDVLVPLDSEAHYKALTGRRLGGEPLAYLTGHAPFYGLDLAVDARVLAPRPDTETLVDWALKLGPGSGDVLDLGTGSGAVALALQHARPTWRVWATDASADALEVAKANAQRLRLGVHLLQGNWFDALHLAPALRFDLIVSNPPYIAEGDGHLAALAHEPALALTSGADGLDAIRAIVTGASTHLAPGGWLLLEHGYDQAARARELLAQAGFVSVASRRDLTGIERCSGGKTSA
jgi:release factor glutamine methyltransferase